MRYCTIKYVLTLVFWYYYSFVQVTSIYFYYCGTLVSEFVLDILTEIQSRGKSDGLNCAVFQVRLFSLII